MPKKIIGIIAILFALLAITVLMYLSLLSHKTALERTVSDRDKTIVNYKENEKKLTDDNRKLGDQLKGAEATQERLKSQLDDLSAKVNVVTSERDDWKGQVDQLRKERDDLMAKLQEQLKKQSDLEKVVHATQETAPASTPSGELPASPTDEKYWAGVLKDKASLGIKLGELQSKLSATSIELEDLKKKNSDLDLELGQLKNEKEEIDRKIKYSEDLANSLSVELAKEKNDKRYVAERLDKFKEENLTLRAQIKELTASKLALEKSINRLGEEKDVVAKKLSETQSIIQDRIDEVLDIKKSIDKKVQAVSSTSQEVELPPIIVSAQNPAAAAPKNPSNTPGLEAHVLSINEENNFIVIDRGENAGIRIGDRLSVYRGTKFIAGLEVIQVRKDIAAADIKQKGAKVKVGDIIK